MLRKGGVVCFCDVIAISLFPLHTQMCHPSCCFHKNPRNAVFHFSSPRVRLGFGELTSELMIYLMVDSLLRVSPSSRSYHVRLRKQLKFKVGYTLGETERFFQKKFWGKKRFNSLIDICTDILSSLDYPYNLYYILPSWCDTTTI